MAPTWSLSGQLHRLQIGSIVMDILASSLHDTGRLLALPFEHLQRSPKVTETENPVTILMEGPGENQGVYAQVQDNRACTCNNCCNLVFSIQSPTGCAREENLMSHAGLKQIAKTCDTIAHGV